MYVENFEALQICQAKGKSKAHTKNETNYKEYILRSNTNYKE